MCYHQVMEGKTYRQRLGYWGEEQAAKFLESSGYQVLARNFTTRYGEVDLVCIQDNVLVFVEVKTRSNDQFGPGEQAVGPRKLRALKRAVWAYLERYHSGKEPIWQIDTVVVEGHLGDSNPKFLHFRNVGASLDD
jgi:putative endonuclease